MQYKSIMSSLVNTWNHCSLVQHPKGSREGGVLSMAVLQLIQTWRRGNVLRALWLYPGRNKG